MYFGQTQQMPRSVNDLKNKIIAKDVDLIIQLSSILQSHYIIMTHTNISYILKYIKIIKLHPQNVNIKQITQTQNDIPGYSEI